MKSEPGSISENIDHVSSDEGFSSGEFQMSDSFFFEFFERMDYFISSELVCLLVCARAENTIRTHIIAGIGNLPYDSLAVSENRKQTEIVGIFFVHITIYSIV